MNAGDILILKENEDATPIKFWVNPHHSLVKDAFINQRIVMAIASYKYRRMTHFINY